MSEINITFKSYAGDFPCITAFCDWKGKMDEIMEPECQLEMRIEEGAKEILCKIFENNEMYYISYSKTDCIKWSTVIQVYGKNYYVVKKIVKNIEKRLISELRINFLNYISNQFIYKEHDLLMTVKITPKVPVYY